MIAKLKHVAIISHGYAMAARFYEGLFMLKSSPTARLANAVALTDGYVGLNVNGRRVGGAGRLDHYGFEIDDLDELKARLRERYPSVELLQRISTRPFAGISMHDPAANYFDISHVSM